ncbi:MAG TPA: SRPBCC family protein [Terriglobales bacterium]|nr:SRPBCC family protein [Terriglobales bacterium]
MEVVVVEEVEAPLDEVWEIASDFGGIQRWSPAIERCTVTGTGVGAVRSVEMNGIALSERLEALDNDRHRLQYSIVEGPLPLKNYLATIEVEETAEDRCRIRWSSTFEPVGLSEEQAKQLIDTIYRQGIQGMRRALV